MTFATLMLTLLHSETDRIMPRTRYGVRKEPSFICTMSWYLFLSLAISFPLSKLPLPSPHKIILYSSPVQSSPPLPCAFLLQLINPRTKGDLAAADADARLEAETQNNLKRRVDDARRPFDEVAKRRLGKRGRFGGGIGGVSGGLIDVHDSILEVLTS